MHFEDEEDEIGSTIERGQLKFAGYHEAVDRRTPVRVLAARELLAANQDKERAWEKLQMAYQDGSSSGKVARLEREYADAQEKVRRLESDEEIDWQSEAADQISLAAAIGRGLEEERARQRVEDFGVLLDYVFQAGVANPWEATKNLLAIVRRIRPELCGGHMTQGQMAKILGETKGAVQARERRVVEEIQIRWGVKGYLAKGGTKTKETRDKLAKAQEGNRNRKSGAAAKHKAAVAGASSAAKKVTKKKQTTNKKGKKA